jgi:hypothetical protein
MSDNLTAVVSGNSATNSIGYKLSLLAVCQGQNRPKSNRFWTSFALPTGFKARTEHQMPLAEMLDIGHTPVSRPTLCRNMAQSPVKALKTSFGVEFDIPTELLTVVSLIFSMQLAN